MSSSTHTTAFTVRDYELDMQGVVNNGVYNNYFEHARHEFLLSKGVDFAALAQQGINLVVARIETDYKRSLRSGDRFKVETEVHKLSRLKFNFSQRIVTEHGDIAAQALVTGVAVDAESLRPMKLDNLDMLFENN
ncbi:acyl-CoA thioesterase [Agaribacterium sp. ZY112]|uniref:acyl-CoA thioesterase n=1 Tax=Agaribacterium sp. ZY112 TaxID=3233574 RepID=UPI00352643D5